MVGVCLRSPVIECPVAQKPTEVLSTVVSNAAAEATRVTGATRHHCDTPAAGICQAEPALNRCGSMRLTNFHFVQRACTPPQLGRVRFEHSEGAFSTCNSVIGREFAWNSFCRSRCNRLHEQISRNTGGVLHLRGHGRQLTHVCEFAAGIGRTLGARVRFKSSRPGCTGQLGGRSFSVIHSLYRRSCRVQTASCSFRVERPTSPQVVISP